MFNLTNGVVEQGSMTRNYTFASAFSIAAPRFSSLKTAARRLRSVFATLLLCAFCATAIYGQDPVDISEFDYDLTTASASSTEIALEFDLGTASNQAENVTGYELNVAIEGWDGTPSTVSVLLGGSWVGDGSEGDLTVSWDYSSGELTVDYDRDDADGQTGDGLVADIRITADPLESLPSGTSARVDGGTLVMIENTGFKTHPFAGEALSAPELTVYPNPTAGTIHLRMDASTDSNWYLASATGQVVRRGAGSLPHSLDLSNEAPGVYFLKVQQGNATAHKKIVLR